MKKALLSGLAVLAVISITALINMELYMKIVMGIAIGSLILSAIFMKVFIRGRDLDVNTDPEEDRKQRGIGMIIAAFGLPFFVTSILLVI
ncbi:DUF5316 family protein [Thalassobacillus hwangdonensis]|uniref:DUF5316 family protein n=1 Tax=Thalassobacillus hwangdonensis TaxID=546108 RepID=A0ABW3L0N0_9BACI